MLGDMVLGKDYCTFDHSQLRYQRMQVQSRSPFCTSPHLPFQLSGPLKVVAGGLPCAKTTVAINKTAASAVIRRERLMLPFARKNGSDQCCTAKLAFNRSLFVWL